MFLAENRRVCGSQFVAGCVLVDWARFYDCLITVGNSCEVSLLMLMAVVKKFVFDPNEPVRLAIDDSPTRRYGSDVEAACVHHNPTGGPADGEWLYGHNWV